MECIIASCAKKNSFALLCIAHKASWLDYIILSHVVINILLTSYLISCEYLVVIITVFNLNRCNNKLSMNLNPELLISLCNRLVVCLIFFNHVDKVFILVINCVLKEMFTILIYNCFVIELDKVAVINNCSSVIVLNTIASYCIYFRNTECKLIISL